MRTTVRHLASVGGGVTVLLSLGWKTDAHSLRVSVGGTFIEANACHDSGVVLGDVVPMLKALGANVTQSESPPRLTGTTFDGRSVDWRVGEKAITIAGKTHPLTVSLQAQNGRIVGPLDEIAQALGCEARLMETGDELRIAGRVAQVETYAADEGALVHIHTTGPSPAKLAMLDDPPRAYVDFPGLTWAGGSEAIQAGGAGGLQRVRWALFQEWPPIARVVLDLEPHANVRVITGVRGLFVVAVTPGRRPPSSNVPEKEGCSGQSLAGVHILVDPAGGEGPNEQITSIERSLSLTLSISTARALMNSGALVTLTRQTDQAESTLDRTPLIRDIAPDLVLRLFCLASRDLLSPRIQTQYGTVHQLSMARALQEAVVRSTGADDGGISLAPQLAFEAPNTPTLACIVWWPGTTPEAYPQPPKEWDQVAVGIVRGLCAWLGRGLRTSSTPSMQRNHQ